MSSKLKSEKQITDQFDSLVTNACDFAQQALSEIDENPKRTIIEFYTAVELFVKARLMKEHWSLIVTKPESASRAAFAQGDFQSVTLKDARERLKNVANDDIGSDAFMCFKEIGNQRNRLVHFHNDDADLRSVVAKDVLKGLYYLDLLVSKKWIRYFDGFEKQWTAIREMAHALTEYLTAKFDAIKDEIAAEVAGGIEFNKCLSCGYVANQITPMAGKFHTSLCRVCELETSCVEVQCPACKAAIFVSEGERDCDSCGRHITQDEVIEQFEPEEPYDKDSLEEYSHRKRWIGQCDECYWLVLKPTLYPMDDSYERWTCVTCNMTYDGYMDECNQCAASFPYREGEGPFCHDCR